MARLYQSSSQIVIYMGWYGMCDSCEAFSLRNASVREKIWKIWQTTSDHKNYIRYDATVPDFFDDIPEYQDFTELKCGYAYKIIMDKNVEGDDNYVDIPNFVFTNNDKDPAGLLTENCFQIPYSPSVTQESFIDLVISVDKKENYTEGEFDIIILNDGNTKSTGEEVHQFFKKIITSSSSSFLLSNDTLFNIIKTGEPNENELLIENFDELNAQIIDSTKLKLNEPINPKQKIIIKVKLNPFVPFIAKVDSTNVIDEKNSQLIDAESNNVIVVDNVYETPTPTVEINTVTQFSLGIRENKTGGVSANPTWLIGPSEYSIEFLPILNLGNGVVRVYINEKLKDGTETGKVDWVALLDEESRDMNTNIVLGANHDENENTIVTKIINSQKNTYTTSITNGEFNSVGWFLEFNSTDELSNDFSVPTEVSIGNKKYYLQKINQSWLLTDENKNLISENGPKSGMLVYSNGTQIKVETKHPSWKIDIGTRVVLPIIGNGKFYTVIEKQDDNTFLIDGKFDNLSEKYIAIDVPSFLLNTHNYMVSPGFQTVDEYKYWVTTGIGASWTNHPAESDLKKYVIEYIEFGNKIFNGIFT